MPNKFLPPYTTTANRTASTPLDGELLYDTDQQKFYQGDGTTVGGIEVGSGGSATLAGLTDTDVTSVTPEVGDTLVWNGTFWVPGSASGGREVLTANRTYYVRTDGSDSNDGLTDSAGGAFLTIQKAIDVAATLDSSTYNIIINVTNNITESVVAKKLTGAGKLIIKSTTGVIQWTGESGISLLTVPAGVTNYETQSIKLTSPDSLFVSVFPGGSFYVGENTNFGSTTSYQLYAVGGYIYAGKNYEISGGGNCHFAARAGGLIDMTGATNTITLTGTPAFSAAFVRAFDAGTILTAGVANTFTGSATGSRYKIDRNSTCYVDGQGTSYFPGSTSGSVDSSSVYY